MKRDTRSRPGVSTRVLPTLVLSWWPRSAVEATVADTDDACGATVYDALRWRRREVIRSASGGRAWWEEAALFPCGGMRARSGSV